MKKIILICSIATMLLASCTRSIFDHRVYTLSTLDRSHSSDINNIYLWECVTKGGDTINLEKLEVKVGDTIEIVHTDYTTSKYILTDIK